jgi:hypothetical protein
MFGVSRATAHRRFTQWTEAGLWPQIHLQVLHRLGEAGQIAWTRAVADSISIRAEKGALKPARALLTAENRAASYTYCVTRKVFR